MHHGSQYVSHTNPPNNIHAKLESCVENNNNNNNVHYYLFFRIFRTVPTVVMYAARFSLYRAEPTDFVAHRARCSTIVHIASDEMAHVVCEQIPVMDGRMNMITEIKANETCGESKKSFTGFAVKLTALAGELGNRHEWKKQNPNGMKFSENEPSHKMHDVNGERE